MKILDLQGRPVLSTGPEVMESMPRVFLSRLPNVGTAITLVSQSAYFVYLGRTSQAIIPLFVEFYVSTAGAGTPPTAEVGFFSTPLPPGTGNQFVTKLVATGTVDALTSTGIKRNSSAFSYIVPAGTNLWAGLRTQMPTTQPTIAGLCMDYNAGSLLIIGASGALTGYTTPQ